ncbi:unnamed protein product, partial [Effrenium voratum]
AGGAASRGIGRVLAAAACERAGAPRPSLQQLRAACGDLSQIAWGSEKMVADSAPVVVALQSGGVLSSACRRVGRSLLAPALAALAAKRGRDPGPGHGVRLWPWPSSLRALAVPCGTTLPACLRLGSDADLKFFGRVA